MQSDNISEALTYLDKEPSIKTLRYAYEQTVNELESYFDLCRNSYDDRRNYCQARTVLAVITALAWPVISAVIVSTVLMRSLGRALLTLRLIRLMRELLV